MEIIGGHEIMGAWDHGSVGIMGVLGSLVHGIIFNIKNFE